MSNTSPRGVHAAARPQARAIAEPRSPPVAGLPRAGSTPQLTGMMLDLTEEEAAALDQLEPRPAQPAASPAVERQIRETWLDDAQPSMMELVAAPPPPVGKSIPSEAVKNGGRRGHWLDYARVALAGFASIAASFAAGFKMYLVSRLRSRPHDD